MKPIFQIVAFVGFLAFGNAVVACEHDCTLGGCGCTLGGHGCTLGEQIPLSSESQKLSDALTAHFPAYLCNDCGFGNRKENCAKCGRWIGVTRVPARLCNDCGFGSRGSNCVKCGKWIGNSRTPAMLCNDCGFGNRKENCVKCGKWAP